VNVTMAKMKPMRRRLITAGLLLGGLALAACGSGGPSVQARQTGETTTTTTTTTTPESTTTTAAPAPTTPAPPTTGAVPGQPPCTADALVAAYTAKFGAPAGSLQAQKCVAGWATSALLHGFDPPTFTLYRAEGDHWVALNSSAGKLCQGQGVPAEVAPQIGCDT
jgi:hypothetical protein